MDEKHIVGREIKMLSNLLIREIDANTQKMGLDRVTAINSWILGYLSCNSERTIYQKDLEKDFSIARSTVTNLVKLMEKKGLIERAEVESDARLKSLKITEKGRQVQHVTHMAMLETEAKLCKDISCEEIESFISVARKMRKNLNPKCGEECKCGKGDSDD